MSGELNGLNNNNEGQYEQIIMQTAYIVNANCSLVSFAYLSVSVELPALKLLDLNHIVELALLVSLKGLDLETMQEKRQE